MVLGWAIVCARWAVHLPCECAGLTFKALWPNAATTAVRKSANSNTSALDVAASGATLGRCMLSWKPLRGKRARQLPCTLLLCTGGDSIRRCACRGTEMGNATLLNPDALEKDSPLFEGEGQAGMRGDGCRGRRAPHGGVHRVLMAAR